MTDEDTEQHDLRLYQQQESSIVAADVVGKLSFLDRFLPLWILLSAGFGLALGQFDEVHSFIDSTTIGGMNLLVGAGLLAMMYPPLANVRWQLVLHVLSNWKLLMLSIIQNWLVAPLLMFFLSAAFFHYDAGFMAGFSLVGCARCIGMVMIWISLAEGDIEYGAALIAVNSLLTLALYSFYARFLLNDLPESMGLAVEDEMHITISEIAMNVGIYMGIPFALSILGWYFLTKWKGTVWYFEKFAPKLDVIALLALLFTIVVLFASQSQRLTTTIGSVLFATIPFLIYFMLIFTSSFWLSSKCCGANYAQSVTVAFTATSNNYELSLGVAVATFGLDSDPAMMSVVAALIEIPTMLLLVYLSFWCKKRFFYFVNKAATIDTLVIDTPVQA